MVKQLNPCMSAGALTKAMNFGAKTSLPRPEPPLFAYGTLCWSVTAGGVLNRNGWRYSKTMDDKRTMPRCSALSRAMFGRLFDYAGLFPPAGLSLSDAVAAFVAHRTGPYAWMLNRFVLPAKKLGEFAELVRSHHLAHAPYPISLLTGNWDDETAEVAPTLKDYADCLAIESFEQKIIPSIKTTQPFYVELSVDDDLETKVAHLKGIGSFAKLRTGGLTPGEFPSSRQIVRFLSACLSQGVPWKATAGLHHPYPSLRPGSSQEQAPLCPMHGFVNFLLAVAILQRFPEKLELAEELLGCAVPEEIRFDAEAIHYKQVSFHAVDIAQVRQQWFHSIGSCSFEEPIEDLLQAGWLPHPS